ncbi:two-component hybrid sensor and regulator [Richelia intracellularis]|nr:two-component hybrid sensor and regulator [Richelia intracellularis]
MGDIYKERSLRQLAEQKLREQANFIDATTDAIIVLRFDGKIIFCNQGGQRIYGWEPSQIQGENVRQLLYDDSSLPQFELALRKVLKHGVWHGELYQYRKDERKIVVEARWNIIRDEQGNPESILTVATDITEKKQLEAQFLRTQRLQSIGTLASGIAHDLNNILTPILAVTQLLPLKLPFIDENTQGLLKIALDNCKRGSDLIKQILSFARGAESLHTTLQVGHLLVEVARVARQTVPKSIEICMDISSKDLWLVSADATQIHQVLMNLCLNARDAMVSGGTLTLAIANVFIDENYANMHLYAHPGSYVMVTISDTGCGIETEILENIFEPFFTTKELGKGTGLGLSTALGIIKSHGGFIDVHSEVAKSTCFKVYLPAVEGTQETRFSELEPPQGSEELILVVDDETNILEITKNTL